MTKPETGAMSCPSSWANRTSLGGRLAIADVVATAPLPEDIRDDVELHVGCMAGAATIDEIESMLADVGFEDIRVTPIEGSREAIREWQPEVGLDDYVVPATIGAVRP